MPKSLNESSTQTALNVLGHLKHQFKKKNVISLTELIISQNFLIIFAKNMWKLPKKWSKNIFFVTLTKTGTQRNLKILWLTETKIF
jgi:hypothetical protein